MKKYSIIILLSTFSYWGSSQNMCGTTGTFSSTTENALRVAQNSTSNSCPYLVRVYFHIVRNSDGTGGQSANVISIVMSNLNVAFGTHGISFQNMGDDEIKNDIYMSAFSNTGPTNTKYIQLIATNVVSNSVNIYLLPDNHPTWSGGLANGFGNSGGSAFVIGGNISFPGSGVQNMVPSKVLPHEMGHCLGLYHTFEELLCREKVDGSNCSTCGDLVCDTPAESPFYIFAENVACAYTTSTTDEDGATYSPILSNIMNYVRPSCMNTFTVGQGSRMRNAIALDPALSLTVASTAFYTGGVYSYGGSTFAINSSSTNISLSNSAKTATITLPNYGSNTVYSWSISNNNGSPSPEYTFLGNNAFLTLYGGNTLNVTCNVTAPCGSGTYNFSLYNYSSFRIVAFPNPANQTLSVSAKLVDTASKTSTDEQLFTTDNINNASISLLDKNGKIINSGKMVNEVTSFNTEKLPNGTYYLHISGGKELITKQILIKH